MPYPIKDYTKPEQYPLPDSVESWRWEFLRRAPEYQAFYRAHSLEEPTVERGLDLRSKFGIGELIDPRLDAGGGFQHPVPSIIRLRTSADWPHYQRMIESGISAELLLRDLVDTLTEIQESGRVVAVIDETVPLQPQFDCIREFIEKWHYTDRSPALRNNRKQEWPCYLRILDARAQGIGDDEIASTLFPETANGYSADFAGRKRVIKAAERATVLLSTFAVGAFAIENFSLK